MEKRRPTNSEPSCEKQRFLSLPANRFVPVVWFFDSMIPEIRPAFENSFVFVITTLHCR